MKAEKNCGVRVGGRGGCRLTPRTCYSHHQSNKCEELLVDSWQQISAQLMRWVICKEQSLSDSSQGTHFPSHTLNSRQREQSSNLTWLQVSFSKNTERKKSSWKNAGFPKAPFHPISTYWPCIFSITQNWTALAGMETQSASVLLSKHSHSDYCKPIWSDTRVSSSGLLAGRAPWAARWRHHSANVHTPAHHRGLRSPGSSVGLSQRLSKCCEVLYLKSESRWKLRHSWIGEQRQLTFPLALLSVSN